MKEFYPNMHISFEDAPFVRKVDASAEIATRDKRIAELEACLRERDDHHKTIAARDARIASLYTEDQMWTFAEEYAASSRAPSVCTAMRRYTPDHNAGMNEDLGGDYVLFADARNANDSLFSQANKRIAELEKQAAIDKTMLALADARINRELRDDFAGRALQGALSSGSFSMLGNRDRAKFAYTLADEMLKAKGGA